MKNKACKLVSDIYQFAEEELHGYCPECGADVSTSFNEKYCGKCRAGLNWDDVDEVNKCKY